MRVVVAPDAFKGSATAVEAAEAIAAGIQDALPGAEVARCPVADGGEGTLDVLLAAGGKRVDLSVHGPLSDTVAAWYVVLDGTAYIESARACGIEHVDPDPMSARTAHTYGVGELLAHALDHGARHLVLTVGGTASTDGGAGMLRALGAEISDSAGAPVPLGGAALSTVAQVDLSPVRRRLGTATVRVATDVTNPLLGPEGAAAVFGPQKGAGDADVAELDKALRHWTTVLERSGAPAAADRPGAGAGGGIAGGAMTALAAQAESGFELIVELTGIDEALRQAQVVITGEGSFDRQSLAGKAPAGVAAAARRNHVPVLVLAGRIRVSEEELIRSGMTMGRALIDHAPSAEAAQHAATGFLRGQAAELIRDWVGREKSPPEPTVG